MDQARMLLFFGMMVVGTLTLVTQVMGDPWASFRSRLKAQGFGSVSLVLIGAAILAGIVLMFLATPLASFD